MNVKMISAAVAVAGALVFPLAACGSSTPPAPVTAAAAPECEKWNAENWTRCADQRSDDLRNHRITPGAEGAAAQQTKHQDSGLPWWSWFLIVSAGLIAALVLGIKLSELNDERRVRRAEAKVAELEARYPDRFGDDDDDDDNDVEDYPEDELDEEDMSFLQRATDPVPAPSAPAQPAPPAGGSLLSSLRQQGGIQ